MDNVISNACREQTDPRDAEISLDNSVEYIYNSGIQNPCGVRRASEKIATTLMELMWNYFRIMLVS